MCGDGPLCQLWHRSLPFCLEADACFHRQEQGTSHTDHSHVPAYARSLNACACYACVAPMPNACPLSSRQSACGQHHSRIDQYPQLGQQHLAKVLGMCFVHLPSTCAKGLQYLIRTCLIRSCSSHVAESCQALYVCLLAAIPLQRTSQTYKV